MTNVPAPWITGGVWSPNVCARHGRPPQSRTTARFISKAPGWAFPLILLGAIVYLIVVSIVRKTVIAANWPYCELCRSVRRQRLFAGFGLLVGGLLLFFVGAGVAADSAQSAAGPLAVVVGLVAFVIGIVVALRSGPGVIAGGVVSADGAWVQFARSDPAFDAEVMAAIARAHELQAAAYQQFGQPPR